jgi:hypothetical protein
MERVAVWNSSWNIFLDHPALGIGLKASGFEFLNAGISYHTDAHNFVLTLLCETGLIGALLYLAAMFHDTGIPSSVPDVDFTVRSAAVAREFTDSHHVPADSRELVANAIAMHHTPGVGLESGAEAYLLSAGAAVDVFGLRSNEIPDAVRQSVIQEYPRLGFKREFAGLLRAEAKQVPRGRAWYLHRFAMSDLSIRLAPFRG